MGGCLAQAQAGAQNALVSRKLLSASPAPATAAAAHVAGLVIFVPGSMPSVRKHSLDTMNDSSSHVSCICVIDRLIVVLKHSRSAPRKTRQ